MDSIILDAYNFLCEHYFSRETSQENHSPQDKLKEILYSRDTFKDSYLFDIVSREFLGYGPLETIINDSQITEILILSPTEIWVEKFCRLEKTHLRFLSPFSYKNILQKICEEAHVQFDLNTPYTNGKWNNFRLHVIAPPLTQHFPQVSFRNHKSSTKTLKCLQEEGWCESEAFLFIKKMISDKSNFLVIGDTGSGKTTTLNALLQETLGHERSLCIEDCDELILPNSVSTKLLTRTDTLKNLTPFDQCDLLKQALRMRPERIIIGEIRGVEAKDFLLTLSSGHRGCFSSLHAGSPKEALLRLEMLTQMGAPQWQTETVRQLIHLSLNYILQVGYVDGKRILLGIYKISSLEKTGFTIYPIYQISCGGNTNSLRRVSPNGQT